MRFKAHICLQAERAEGNMASALQQFVPATGSISFEQFRADAEAAGVRVDLWHRAKRVGEFRTYTTESGEIRLTREETAQDGELVVWQQNTTPE